MRTLNILLEIFCTPICLENAVHLSSRFGDFTVTSCARTFSTLVSLNIPAIAVFLSPFRGKKCVDRRLAKFRFLGAEAIHIFARFSEVE